MMRYLYAIAAIAVGSAALAAETIQPLPEGEHIAATTHFELAERFSDLSENEIEELMIGSTTDDDYIVGRLHEATDFGIVNVEVPNDGFSYGPRAGMNFQVAYFVSYPTSPDNPREDYVFPFSKADSTFEKMQQAGEKPIFADPVAKYPLVLISHGYRAHGLWDLGSAKRFARHGYISASMFYGDGRFPNDNQTVYQLMLRPLISKAVLDDLLASDFGEHIDLARIGMAGNSFGGLTTAAMLGGRIANSIITPQDSRIRAGVGVVPWLGAGTFHPFGTSNIGVDGVDNPFLTIYGTEDDVAPPSFSLPALNRMSSDAYAVALHGAPHILRSHEHEDAMNWQLLFFDAYLKDNYKSLKALKSAESFEGSANDQQMFEYQRIVPRPDLARNEAFGGENGIADPQIDVVRFQGEARYALTFSRLIDTSSVVYELQASEDLSRWDYIESKEIEVPHRREQAFQVDEPYRLATLMEFRPDFVHDEADFLRVRARRR